MTKICFIYVLLLLGACSHLDYKKASLPSFNLLLADGTTIFNTNQITEGKSTILMFFSPDCEHCQRETECLLKKMDSLKEVQFYFITIDPFERLKIFNTYYKIYNYGNIILARDYTFFFPRYFKGAAPPYLVIYDKHKRQRLIFEGEASASQVIEAVNY